MAVKKRRDYAKVWRVILLASLYSLIFLIANKLICAYRTSVGANILQRILATTENVRSVILPPFPSTHPIDFMSGLAAIAALFLIFLYRRKHARKWRTDIEYGSARWGGKRDIEPFMDNNIDKNIILTATESLTLDGRPVDPKNARNKNVLVIGGSGSGKTRFFVKPNLMQLHSSYVVTDPKGSLLTECGTLLKNEGYELKVLNTVDFTRSMHYNPLHYIHSEKDILKFVNALMANTKGEGAAAKDPFWEKAELLLYCALVGYIYYEAPDEERNIVTLVEMIGAMEVREEDESFKNAIDLMFDELEARDYQHFAVRQYKKFKLAAGKTAKSILVSCGARLAPFDIRQLREIMSYDEMDLDTLGDRRSALSIIISDTDDSFNFVAALMYSQLFNLLCDKAENVYGGRLPVHVRFLLDEFANIGKIPKFEKLIATIRSREMSACVILQAASQLKAIYKDDADTIVGNMDSRLFLGGTEKTTLKDLSESLGKETIDLQNCGISRGNAPSYSKNFQKLGRELMSIDELSVLDGGKCILQLRGVRPFLSDKYDITDHKNYRFLSDNDSANAFNCKAFIEAKATVAPDEAIEMFELEEEEPPFTPDLRE